MEARLQQLNEVPGVIGSMLCDGEGGVVAGAFPPSFDKGTLRNMASLLLGRTAALQPSLGGVQGLDLRFGSVRVVVRAVESYRLLFLCSPAVNLSLLGLVATDMLRNVAAAPEQPLRNLAVPAERPPSPARDDSRGVPLAALRSHGSSPERAPRGPPHEARAGALLAALQRIDAAIAKAGGNPYRLRGKIAVQSGLALELIGPDTPDDSEQLKRLMAAARNVLGREI